VSLSILFVRSYPLIDGSLTYQLRLAKKLNEKQQRVTFLFTCQIEENIQQLISETAPWVYKWNLAERSAEHKIQQDVDVIHAGVDGDGIAMVYDLKKKYFPGAAIVFAAWASNAFIHTSKLGFSADGLFYKYFLDKLPARNLTFMGPTIKQKHEQFTGLDMSASPIIPNSLFLPSQFNKDRKVKPHKLVSVGRLSPSKEYVFATIDVIKALNKKNIHYEFHIYGSGEYANQISSYIRSYQLEQQVFVHGEIPYSAINSVLADAQYFIGMGAAIIEAAALGIPSLQAVEYNKAATIYGWFHEMTDEEIGEYNREKRMLSIETILENAYTIEASAYLQMSEKTFERAQTFSIDRTIIKYLSFIEHADRKFIFHFPRWKQLVLKVARQPFKLIRSNLSKEVAKMMS
jgi:glycosyltransferase involved in cell wall biosynthesis